MPIDIKNLSFSYKNSTGVSEAAIKDITFEIRDLETLCIIGHTGSGKSTLMQQINGLLQPDNGSVQVNGVSLNDKKARYEIRKTVGMVFQYPEYQLFEETVEKDIAFGPKNMGIPEDQIKDYVQKAMKTMNLDYEKYAQKSPFELSGGEKRRVAMAGTLATDPDILILDEPMAGLDPIGRKDMLGLIYTLKQTKTIIIVSHNMDDVALLADRVAVLSKGELVMADTVQNVFSQPELLFKIRLDVPKATNFAIKMRQRYFSLTGKELEIPNDIFRFQQLIEGIQGCMHV